MRVLLVNPSSAINLYRQFGGNLPPLGLAYLASVLREDAHQVEIADLEVEPGRKVDFSRYDLVGITSLTPQYSRALELARLAKKEGIHVVMGGYHVSFQDQEALSTGVVDYVVRGEGEHVFRELVNCLELGRKVDDVPGISFMKDGHLFRNPQAPYISDLDRLPLPARDLLPMDKYVTMLDEHRATSMVTSRGCPFNCTFCVSSKMGGLKWRTRTIDSIINEIKDIKDRYGYRGFLFMDDNFTLNPKRVIQFAEQLIKRRLNIFWWCFSRVDTIVKNEYMVKKMAEAGARTVFLGVESANQETLDEYHKKITLRQLYRAWEILRDYKLKIWGSFIIGGVHETKKMIDQTIQLARKLNPDTAQFSILTPYPGTQLFKSVKDRIVVHNWDLYDGIHAVMRTKHLSPAEIQKSIVKAYSKFYLRFCRWPRVFSYIKERKLKLSNVLKGIASIWRVERSSLGE
ncbi:MAG: hypothetical protein B1H40_02955 [Candidatus Latescibacteria bacterium 4484_181]|nr:MAG: hypothetical protein B1H40_02955 [Candidatus Latescibacteria bacterium 4484_181]RKY68009.1 MAG: radical SAM protein [Candidatus Latescibacterota bacterium]RKY72700.1 MAG: radical SAM protein [Candidatus Latescibacterota bacterium]